MLRTAIINITCNVQDVWIQVCQTVYALRCAQIWTLIEEGALQHWYLFGAA